MEDIEKILLGQRLITLEILYFFPDYPDLLQSFLWQVYDIPPEYPRIFMFLDYWTRYIEAPVYSINIATSGHLVTPPPRFAAFVRQI